MVNLTSIRVRGELYVPDKYKNQASEYNKCIDDVNTTLDGAITELEGINTMLGLDSESSKDVLTINVLTGNEEIKEEIENLVTDLENYSSAIEVVANKLDKKLEDEAMAILTEMEQQETLKKAAYQDDNNNTTSKISKLREDTDVSLLM